MENKKVNWILWIGLAIPVVALVFVAIFAYMPTSLDVKYDFLYYVRDYKNYYACVDGGEIYTVKNQKVVIATPLSSDLIKKSECNYDLETDPPKIYRYSVTNKNVTELSLLEAQKLQVDNNPISPDGVSVQRGDYNNMGIFELFGGNQSRYNSVYLKDKKGALMKANIDIVNSYNFVFIGWVLK